MYINRDMSKSLSETSNLVQILLGPRQCGKSTLFAALAQDSFQEITFDDLQMRQLANRDPALFLQQFNTPLILDEVQYVPNLFPEIKRKIDLMKKERTLQAKSMPNTVLYRLTGSNQILMDKNIKESLVGRAAYYYLNTLTVHEILQGMPTTSIKEIIFKGGWPELYTQKELSVTHYLNDYIRSYVEKDILQSAGIHKLNEFHTVLGLLAARTGNLMDYTNVANDSGISAVTVKEWTSLLAQADLVYLLRPYFSNLNKRLIKTPKLYFLDTGLAARLQGWSDPTPLFGSMQIGSLFETLVLAEILKFIRNYQKNWELFFWRTKEGDEIDFILKTENEVHAFETKLAIQGWSHSISYPVSFKNEFNPQFPLVVVTFGGKKIKLSSQCMVLPIAELHDYLQEMR